MMKLKTLFILMLAVVFSGCGLFGKKSGNSSRTTGWAYNSEETGNIPYESGYEQDAGPGLVFVQGGTFTMGRVEEDVIDDAASCRFGTHAANLGLIIAGEWQRAHSIPAIFVDAPVTDELSPLAQVSGYSGISRSCAFHALNAKRVASLIEQKLLMERAGGRLAATPDGALLLDALVADLAA